MLKQLKRTVLRASRGAGTFRLLRNSHWRRSRLLIIGYHGVSVDDEHEWKPTLYITPAVLEERFKILRDGGYTVLPLGEAVTRLASNTLPPRSVVLTFDDGFVDFALEVFPLLQRFAFPATVYLTTYYTQFNRPIFGLICSYMLWKSARTEVRSTDIVPGIEDEIWDLRSASGRERAHEVIVRHAASTGLSAREKDSLAEHVAAGLGIDYQDLIRRRILSLLTPSEVTSLSAAGIDFELHTHRHRTPVDAHAFHREIEDNRRVLAELTGKRTSHFCYPSGVYEPEFLPWLSSAGVVSATTCDTGIASQNTNPLLLPRLIDTMNISAVEFESWVSGAGAFLPLRRHEPMHGFA
jgi:peptidoglycan/xylan/chitin deacetylase (PgdA/CDA1 family)